MIYCSCSPIFEKLNYQYYIELKKANQILLNNIPLCDAFAKYSEVFKVLKKDLQQHTYFERI